MSQLYRFLILAYEKESKSEETPGLLEKATEIYITTTSAAAALAEARELFLAKNYFIKRIEKV